MDTDWFWTDISFLALCAHFYAKIKNKQKQQNSLITEINSNENRYARQNTN